MTRKFKTVPCGPDCQNCEPEERLGIAIVTQYDHFGISYPEATTIILRDGEWHVSVLDPDSPMGTSVVATYPQDKVVGFRNIPCETQLYVHRVDLPDDEEEEAPELFPGPPVGLIPVYVPFGTMKE